MPGNTSLAQTMADCTNIFGALDNALKQKLLAVILDPTPHTWDDAYSIIIDATNGGITLWQAVIAIDGDMAYVSRPTSHRFDNPSHRWAMVPDTVTIVRAIQVTVGCTPPRSVAARRRIIDRGIDYHLDAAGKQTCASIDDRTWLVCFEKAANPVTVAVTTTAAGDRPTADEAIAIAADFLDTETYWSATPAMECGAVVF